MAQSKLHFQTTGTWSGAWDVNAGDPGAAGPGTTFTLSGYEQTSAVYENLDAQHHILSLGVGHKALFLDDPISGPQPVGGRLSGIDVINGNSGGQIIDLTSYTMTYGDVTINGGKDDDILMASAGNDSLKGGAGSDYLWGGSGNDTMTGGTGNDTVLGGTGNDQLYGGQGNDKMDAGAGNDVLYGGTGDDTMIAGLGNQAFYGSSGSDTVDFSMINSKLRLDLGNHLVTYTADGVAYTDHISAVETIIGSNQGNFFDGIEKHGLNYIGGSGDDRFHSEGGGDSYTGGGGANVFDWMKKYVLLAAKSDVVTDFHVGTDHLDLSDFLKGQVGIKHPSYDQVVHLVDNDAGTMLQVRAGGVFHDAVELVGVHNAALSDLLLH